MALNVKVAAPTMSFVTAAPVKLPVAFIESEPPPWANRSAVSCAVPVSTNPPEADMSFGFVEIGPQEPPQLPPQPLKDVAI